MSESMKLEQEWMCIMGPQTDCETIHPGSTCRFEIISKCAEVVKVSSKLYALLYLAMFVVRFRKIQQQRKIKQTIVAWSTDYLWSLAFMSWTVGGMKTALCLLNKMNSPLDGRAPPVLSLLASPSIFCLQKSRRSQVVLFTFARSCRSLYLYLKKRLNFKISSEREICFVALYGILSLIYFENPGVLRNKQILSNLWGEF